MCTADVVVLRDGALRGVARNDVLCNEIGHKVLAVSRAIGRRRCQVVDVDLQGIGHRTAFLENTNHKRS